MCKYRKQIIGFEEEQGKEQIGHHLNVKGILFDEENRSFIENNNKWALKDMSERMLETIQRGMWENPSEETVEKLQKIFLDSENELE